MTIFRKELLIILILGVLGIFNLAEIIPFEPESLTLMQGSKDLIKL